MKILCRLYNQLEIRIGLFAFSTQPNECLCTPGWSGPNCDQCQTHPGCPEQGTCTRPWECFCEDNSLSKYCFVQNKSIPLIFDMPRDTCHSYNIVASRPSRRLPSLAGNLSNQLSQSVGEQGHGGNLYFTILHTFKMCRSMYDISDNESSSNSGRGKGKETSGSSGSSKVETNTNGTPMESSNSAGISSNTKVDSGLRENSENEKKSMKND